MEPRHVVIQSSHSGVEILLCFKNGDRCKFALILFSCGGRRCFELASKFVMNH